MIRRLTPPLLLLLRLDHAPAGSYAHLAMLIGGARGLPPALSDELASASCETWGEWSRDMQLGGTL